MKTKIYKNYEEFLKRENKEENGVSENFSKNNPNYKKENIKNKGCWNCRSCSDCSYCSYCSSCSDCSYCSYCSDCSDCSDCSSCSDCSDCSDCSSCSDCSDCSYCSYCSSCSDCSDCSSCSDCSDCSDCSSCSDCSDCSSCSDCSDCSDCSSCSDCSDKKGDLIIPKIDNIHEKVLNAVNNPNALEMSTWHTCETTHCRAGWVVMLAGQEGKKLEKKTSTLFAAMTIYRKSSSIPVHIPRFFDTNEKAIEDIKKCAELEKGK